MRRVCYVSGTRADFGLMAQTLCLVAQHDEIDLSVCVTGMHLSSTFGHTIDEIEASGIRICARVPVDMERSSGSAMAKALGGELIGMTEVFECERPDLVMVLGDRGEMLAAALAAIHLNIPIVHLHGGERSGTVDEPVRHALSKLSHYHFVATEGARERLIRMGEDPDHIFVTGAPGLDRLVVMAKGSREELCAMTDFNPKRPIALVVFHPVLQESEDAGRQTQAIMAALLACKLQALCLMPNADAGGSLIRQTLEGYRTRPDLRLVTHLPRRDFVSWMAVSDIMVGNSSSGIIEAASFGLPVVNIGNRQKDRERSGNTIDVPAETEAIRRGMLCALEGPRGPWINVYGHGQAGERIVELLTTLPLTPQLMLKSNGY